MHNPTPSNLGQHELPTTSIAGIGSTLQRLQEQIASLERERDYYKQAFESSRAEHADLHRAVTDMVRKQYSDEELRRFAEMEDEESCLELSQFMGELEEIVQGPNSGQ